jgi:hypothetical protein
MTAGQYILVYMLADWLTQQLYTQCIRSAYNDALSGTVNMLVAGAVQYFQSDQRGG